MSKKSLRERFEQFIRTVPGIENIDDLVAGESDANYQRADYLAANRNVVVELKTLEDDTEWKVEEVLSKHRDRDEFPMFFGGWELSKVLNHLPDGEEINHAISQKVTTSVRKIFRKSNNQIRFTKKEFGLPNAQGFLIVLNERIGILTPETLAWTLDQISRSRLESGEFRYTDLRAAMIVSEAHGKELPNDTLAYPIILINFQNGERFEHEEFLNSLDRAWADFNDARYIAEKDEKRALRDLGFVRVSELYEKRKKLMPRYEAWARYYAWNPYFREFDDEHLKWLYNLILFEAGKGMLKGSTAEDTARSKEFWMEVFTHFMEEVKHRGIDLRFFTSDEKVSREFDQLMKERFG